MTNIKEPKVQSPTAADRAYVAGLVAENGVKGAARKLGISRLSVLNLASGNPCQCRTHAAVKALREAA
jgi:hypothetical protein